MGGFAIGTLLAFWLARAYSGPVLAILKRMPETEEMTDQDFSEIFEESMLDHFEQNIFPESSDEDAFIEWERQQLSNPSGKD